MIAPPIVSTAAAAEEAGKPRPQFCQRREELEDQRSQVAPRRVGAVRKRLLIFGDLKGRERPCRARDQQNAARGIGVRARFDRSPEAMLTGDDVGIVEADDP